MFHKITNIGLYGDSILKGIQVNPENKKYYVNNQIHIETIGERYALNIENYSSFGCTVTKGKAQLQKRLERGFSCDAVIMDYGGNDCDFDWRSIAENPAGEFLPNTPLETFRSTYKEIIDLLIARGIQPILTTLPPLEPQRFFDWFCKDLNKENVLQWLGEIRTIYRHQEEYSQVVEEIAREKAVPIIDIRRDFLERGDIGALLCEDGTHPNSIGQSVIAETLNEFAKHKLVISI